MRLTVTGSIILTDSDPRSLRTETHPRLTQDFAAPSVSKEPAECELNSFFSKAFAILKTCLLAERVAFLRSTPAFEFHRYYGTSIELKKTRFEARLRAGSDKGFG